jgi:hypothetical protein
MMQTNLEYFNVFLFFFVLFWEHEATLQIFGKSTLGFIFDRGFFFLEI